MDQRSGDGRFGGRLEIIAPNSVRVFSHFPNFEIVDARIASALKKIIMNPYFRKKVSLEEQKSQMDDRFLRERQIAHMTYEYFRVSGAHEAVLDSTDLFSISSRATIFRILIPYGIKFY